jgi:hypothetical protein
MFRLIQSRHSDLNFDRINQNPHADMDFNFGADDIQMDMDPAPVALEERIGNSPHPDSASKKQKVNLSCCILSVRLRRPLNCSRIEKVGS